MSCSKGMESERDAFSGTALTMRVDLANARVTGLCAMHIVDCNGNHVGVIQQPEVRPTLTTTWCERKGGNPYGTCDAHGIVLQERTARLRRTLGLLRHHA